MNNVIISGKIVNEGITHKTHNETLHQYLVQVPRLSGAFDTLPVVIPERLMTRNYEEGDIVRVVGQFRSANKVIDGKSRLILKIYAKELLYEEIEKINEISLKGYICKSPVYRTTPFDREITDMLIAVNRRGNQSDYIPCIAWGRNARFAKDLKVGDKILVSGRIQSRDYRKNNKTMTAYEVSISSLSVENKEVIENDTGRV